MQFSPKTADDKTILLKTLESLPQLREKFSPAVNKDAALTTKIHQLDVITHYLHNILANISQGILFVDFTGIVTTYNPAAQHIFGIDPLDLLFNNYWNFFADDAFGFSMKDALKKQKAPKTSFAKFKSAQGEERLLEIRTSFVIDNPPTSEETFIESIQGMVILIRDLSEIEHLQTIANRHNRLQELGEMASLMAHEIKNPLGGIKGFASLLQKDLKDHPHLQQMANYIVEGADNLNRIVNEALRHSRPLKPTFANIDLGAFTQELRAHVLADPSFNRNIAIAIHSQDIVLVPADSHLLRSAILNLIVNAAQAIENKGKIDILIQREIDSATISISDTGVGIPQENLPKIFSPFFTTKSEGNGFGLAEVHKIVQAHGGTIKVSSTIGKGSVFVICLPLNAYASP